MHLYRYRVLRFSIATSFLLCCLSGHPAPLLGQDSGSSDEGPQVLETDQPLAAPAKVEVEPLAVDEDISARLQRIFKATQWFESPRVETDEGVVFLSGTADNESHRQWAEDAAQNTSDVVAVVNRMRVQERPVWDIRPALVQMEQLGRDFTAMLPLLVVAIAIVTIAYLLAKLAARMAQRVASRRVQSQLLQQVVSSVVVILVILIGVYIALKVSGLSRLAVTVLGGTGIVGLAFGFAFRDIAENYLASILISLNRPFSIGDLISVENNKGYVRRVTTRGTLLLTIEGNHIQIPNSTIYKSIVTNFSSSPRTRKDFQLGIGYDDSVAKAQEIVRRVVDQHEAVLVDPAPQVLVDSLGASTVNLNVLFWIDTKHFDAISVRSVLIRQTKSALTDASISMPDEAREIVFPNGVPVTMVQTDRLIPPARERNQRTSPLPDRPLAENAKLLESDKADATAAEGNLKNTSDKLQEQSKANEPSDSENLI